MMHKNHYNQQTNIYTKYASVVVAKGCAGFMVTNTGDSVARVNQMVLNPDPRNVINPTLTFLGDSRTIMLHKGDVYVGTIEIQFTAGGTAPRLEIVQLFYTDDY